MGGYFDGESFAARLFSASLTAVVASSLAVGYASGQTPAPDQPGASSSDSIPLPKRFMLKDPSIRRTASNGQGKQESQHELRGTPTVPDIPALQDMGKATDASNKPIDTRATPPSPPRMPVDTELIPGRVVEPIDLANALRLAGARDLDIAVARQQIFAASG